jgi:hypothetical protein
MAGFRTIVRDGRVGRDPTLVTEDGGEILGEFEADHPVDIGERLTLPDGNEVVVIGQNVAFGGMMVPTVTVHVGDLFE